MKYKVEIHRQMCEAAVVVVDLDEIGVDRALHEGILQHMQTDELFALAADRFKPLGPYGPYINSVMPTDDDTPTDVEMAGFTPMLRKPVVLRPKATKLLRAMTSVLRSGSRSRNKERVAERRAAEQASGGIVLIRSRRSAKSKAPRGKE